MLNTMIVAAVTNFSGTTTPDKNGAAPVMLQCIAGTMPNRNVLAGTVAIRAGFEVGKTYLVNVRETGYDDIFGPDFTFIKIMELTSGLDIVRSALELGEARIVYVQRPEGFETHYKRKGDAVESNRTRRIQEGLYHPTVQTTTSEGHRTARAVKAGSSVGSGGEIINEEEMLHKFEGEGDFDEFPEPESEEQGEEGQGDEGEQIRDESETRPDEQETDPGKRGQGNRNRGQRGNRGNQNSNQDNQQR